MPRTFFVTWKFQVIVEADDPETVNSWAEYRRQEMRRVLDSPAHPFLLTVLGSPPDELTCYEMPDEEQSR